MAHTTGKKKVAIVSSSAPPFSSGGVASSHFNLYLLLREFYDVRLFTFDDAAAAEEPELVRRGLSPWLKKAISLGAFACFRLMGEGGVVYQLSDALAGALAGVKLLPALRRFAPDIVVVPDHGAVSALWPRLEGARIVFVSHHNSMRFCREPLLGRHSERDALAGKWFEQRAIGKCHAVICPSRYMEGVFGETYRFEGPVEVIPNVMDTALIGAVSAAPLREMLGLSAQSPLVYIPSAGTVYKGKQFVFELIRRISHPRPEGIGFYLSGALDPDLAQALKYLPEGIRIYAPGAVSYFDNLANVKACTLCVSPTLVENFSMALLEAQWSGIPVVAFDAGGTGDVVIDGVTGYLAPYLDVEALIRSSLTLLDSPQERERLAGGAAREMRQRFGKELLAQKYRDLFALIS